MRLCSIANASHYLSKHYVALQHNEATHCPYIQSKLGFVIETLQFMGCHKMHAESLQRTALTTLKVLKRNERKELKWRKIWIARERKRYCRFVVFPGKLKTFRRGKIHINMNAYVQREGDRENIWKISSVGRTWRNYFLLFVCVQFRGCRCYFRCFYFVGITSSSTTCLESKFSDIRHSHISKYRRNGCT